MPKFTFFVDAVSTATYVVEADDVEKGEEIVRKIMEKPEFADEYRKKCDIMEHSISDTVIVDEDTPNMSFIDRWDYRRGV